MREHRTHIALITAAAGLLLTGTSLVSAQTTRPATAATQPATTQVSPSTKISFNFRDAPIDTVLEHLSQVAGFVVVKTAPMNGRVTVISKQPISPQEAVTLLNTVLKANGYTAIQMDRILKIVASDQAKKGGIPVYFGAEPDRIIPSDNLITQVIPVRSVDAVKLKADLQPLVSGDADFTANAGSNSLIMTDTAANIRRIVEVVSNLDKRDSLENSIRVRHLTYADATSTAKLITDIFKNNNTMAGGTSSGPQTPGNGQDRRARFMQAMRAVSGGESQQQTTLGQVLASADVRTNTIVVTGPSDTLKVIDDMLEKLDANPASEQSFFIYAVKNGQSQNMAAVLDSLFGTGTASGSRTTQTTSGSRLSSNASSLSNTGRGGSQGPFGGRGSTAFGNSNQQINRQGAFASANVPANVAGAAADLIGQVYVVADSDTNSLLVATASKYEERVRHIVEMLDRPVPQVLIKVLIAEVTHENASDFGVDFSVLNRRPSGNGQSAGTDFSTPTINGGLLVSVLETNVTATLRALAQANKLDVLSRPYILASNNQLASITVGQIVPIVTNTRVTDTGQTINSISYQDIGIILNVTPHINPDGLVILDVSPEISQISSSTVQISEGLTAPVFDLRSADSRVGIRDGQTIVIGGLMEDRKTSNVQKVPLLGDIPILGTLFRRTIDSKTKTELLIFLTPHVAQEPDQLQSMSQDEMKGTQLVPNAVAPGMFQDQMRGMERGAATQPSTQPVSEP